MTSLKSPPDITHNQRGRFWVKLLKPLDDINARNRESQKKKYILLLLHSQTGTITSDQTSGKRHIQVVTGRWNCGWIMLSCWPNTSCKVTEFFTAECFYCLNYKDSLSVSIVSLRVSSFFPDTVSFSGSDHLGICIHFHSLLPYFAPAKGKKIHIAHCVKREESGRRVKSEADFFFFFSDCGNKWISVVWEANFTEIQTFFSGNMQLRFYYV